MKTGKLLPPFRPGCPERIVERRIKGNAGPHNAWAGSCSANFKV